jgi:ATP-dependent DNA helicase RecQ
MSSPKEVLQTYWSYENFRPNQEAIINRVLENQDTIALLPTGGGKSLCYQLPALLSNGCTLVISPLISLMQDQVEQMNEKGIKSMMLNNSQALNIQLDNCLYGNFKLLYSSPEKALSKEFLSRIKKLNITRVAVDEAHCISEWGNDFRPAFKQINKIRTLLPSLPILALTATATPKVLEDIIESLQLKQTSLFQGSYARNNININTLYTEDKQGTLIKILMQNKQSGIVYCGNRRETEQIAKLLQQKQISCAYFHGGRSASERKELLQEWQSEKIKIMVATNAFGMGIDKAEVRTVIHLNLPSSIENFYQEIGRSGRNGGPANAYLLIHENDKIKIRQQFIGSLPDKEFIQLCFKNLCNYLNIAYGEGKEVAHNLLLVDFCKTYSMNPRKTLSTFTYLEQEGIFNLIKFNKQRAVVKFLITQTQILELLKNQTDDSKIIQAIIRNHQFSYARGFELDINRIIRSSQISFKTLLKSLRKWENEENLELEYNQTDIQIQWLVPREDQYTLAPLLQRLTHHNKVKKEKIEAMINYAFNTERCKHYQILSYFGEKYKGKCGNCNALECNSKK